jgi:hypothetical protein
MSVGLALVMLAAGFAETAAAQEEVGGPYTPDENTVLLMHFDGTLDNEAAETEDGVWHGTADPAYIDNGPLGLGEALRVDNDSQSDSSFVTVADHAVLDLEGDWTIEGWINVFTFGQTSTDWRWVPRLIIKPGDEVFWRPNYWIEMWGDQRFFSSGYHAASGNAWPQSNTATEVVQPGQWYHITFIRDTEENVIAQLVHNAERELVAFSSYRYDPITEAPPMLNSMPVHIGYAGGGSTDSWLDGFVDEVRVSNVVRDFPVPPIMTEGTELPNQTSDVAGYEISVNAFKLGTGNVDEVTLHYCVAEECTVDAGFQTAAMTATGDRVYAGTIPQQPVGTIVNYYVSATDDDGLRATFPSNVEVSEDFPAFGIYTPSTQTLALDFEEGTGTPVDASVYAQEVTVFGDVTYSTDAMEGEYALDFDPVDSSYIEIAGPSPFLSSNELTVELWFNADSMVTNTRLIGKESGTWFQQNFEMKFGPGHRLAAGSYHPDGTTPFVIDSLVVDDSLALNTWYKAVYVLSADSAILQIEDAEGGLVGRTSFPVETSPIAASGPFRIGHSGPPSEPFYDGRVDGVAIYNYALEEYVVSDEDDGELPAQVTLKQNYPNPFNPATTINYQLPSASDVQLRIFDALGREVATLVDTQQAAGSYQVAFDGSRLSSGIYFYRLETESATRVRSMLLTK